MRGAVVCEPSKLGINREILKRESDGTTELTGDVLEIKTTDVLEIKRMGVKM